MSRALALCLLLFYSYSVVAMDKSSSFGMASVLKHIRERPTPKENKEVSNVFIEKEAQGPKTTIALDAEGLLGHYKSPGGLVFSPSNQVPRRVVHLLIHNVKNLGCLGLNGKERKYLTKKRKQGRTVFCDPEDKSKLGHPDIVDLADKIYEKIKELGGDPASQVENGVMGEVSLNCRRYKVSVEINSGYHKYILEALDKEHVIGYLLEAEEEQEELYNYFIYLTKKNQKEGEVGIITLYPA